AEVEEGPRSAALVREGCRAGWLCLQEPEPGERGEELVEGVRGQGSGEPLFDSLADDLQGSAAVELLDDVGLDLLQAEELPGRGVLDDQGRPSGDVLSADDEITSEPRFRDRHGGSGRE